MDQFGHIQFDWSLDPQELTRAYKKTNFDEHFYKLISRDVIATLSPQLLPELYKLDYDEALVYDRLIRPLELFIFNLTPDASQDEINQTINYLKNLEQPNKMCRRFFRPSDVMFYCNDCGVDATCVLCIDCFHKSAHKDHNYRMSTSENGGGCCDCGDLEAWKQFPGCLDHQAPDYPNLDLSKFDDSAKRLELLEEDKVGILQKISQLPEGFATRYFLICNASLHYAKNIMNWAAWFKTLPPFLDISKQLDKNDPTDRQLKKWLDPIRFPKNYFCVLYDYRPRDHDIWISNLAKTLKCSNESAETMVTTLRRKNRTIIYQGSRKSCRRVRNALDESYRTNQGPRCILNHHGSALAHQTYSLHLIKWIQRMASLCDGYRVLTATTLFGGHDPWHKGAKRGKPHSKDSTFLNDIIISNICNWSTLRILWNELMIKTLLNEYTFRNRFARIFTRNYSDLLLQSIDDSCHYSSGVITLTTQLYPARSQVHMLIEEEGALNIMIEAFVMHVYPAANPDLLPGSLLFKAEWDIVAVERSFQALTDIGHLINFDPCHWTDRMRHEVVKFLDKFLDFLRSVQEQGALSRHDFSTEAYENEYANLIAIEAELVDLVAPLVRFCSKDKKLLEKALCRAQRKLMDYIGQQSKAVSQVSYHLANCVTYKVSEDPVSLHIPLTRFAAALILELMRERPCNSLPYDHSLVIFRPLVRGSHYSQYARQRQAAHSIIDMMELALRTQVLVAQYRCGMWTKHDDSLGSQIRHISEPQIRRETYDRDILLLQEGAAMCDANEFLLHLLNKFELTGWANKEVIFANSPSLTGATQADEVTMSLVEEFLRLLLTLIGERYRVGLGKIQKDQVTKNEMIHLLCISPRTRSDILQLLDVKDGEFDLIKSVADFNRFDDTTPGKYELKKEFYVRFNPFFYHLSRRKQSEALDAQLKRKRTAKERLLCCPPPEPVELTQQFKNINHLLICDMTLSIIQRVLHFIVKKYENPPTECTEYLASDRQLDLCLHLIGLGLYEQARRPCQFDYIKAAHEKDIFGLLEQCYTKAKRSEDLIIWLMEKMNAVFELLAQDRGEPIDEQQKSLYQGVRSKCLALLSLKLEAKQETPRQGSDAAAKRRDRIIAMMKSKQEKFLAHPAIMKLATEAGVKHRLPAAIPYHQPPLKRTTRSSVGISTSPEPAAGPSSAMDIGDNSTNGPWSSLKLDYLKVTIQECMLCREEQLIGFDEPTMVLLAYVQPSSALSKDRNGVQLSNGKISTSKRVRLFDLTSMLADLNFGLHISTCGHIMHAHCWEDVQNETPEDEEEDEEINADWKEDRCPLCKCITNATIPLVAEFTNFSPPRSSSSVAENGGGRFTTTFNVEPQNIVDPADDLATFTMSLRNTIMNETDPALKQGTSTSIEPIFILTGPLPTTETKDLVDSITTSRFSLFLRSSPKPLSKAIEILTDRIFELSKLQHLTVNGLKDYGSFTTTSWVVSYTIQAHERAARFKGTPILEDSRSSKDVGLSSLVRFACASVIIYHPETIRGILRHKLRYLLVRDEHLKSSLSFLDVDVFELFISTFMAMQKLHLHVAGETMQASLIEMEDQMRGNFYQFKASATYDHDSFRNLLRLSLIMHMLQVSLTTLVDINDNVMETEQQRADDGDECVFLRNFFQHILSAIERRGKLPNVDYQFVRRIRRALLPFLRSCALGLYHLVHSQPSETLTKRSAFREGKDFGTGKEYQPIAFNDNEDLDKSDEEFEAICNYLNLPTKFNILLDSQEAHRLVLVWLSHPRVQLLFDSQSKNEHVATESAHDQQIQANLTSCELGIRGASLIRQPQTVNRLVDLPDIYSKLIDKISNFTCPKIENKASPQPTMCLVCGTILCSQCMSCQYELWRLKSNRFTDKIGLLFDQFHLLDNEYPEESVLIGSCTYHAHLCSAGLGIFLRIRECQILLRSSVGNGCYVPAPYIDDHGEHDPELLRGNALYLNRELYERLQSAWMNHSIPEMIARNLLENCSCADYSQWYLH